MALVIVEFRQLSGALPVGPLPGGLGGPPPAKGVPNSRIQMLAGLRLYLFLCFLFFL